MNPLSVKTLYLIATLCLPGGQVCQEQNIANSDETALNEIHCAYGAQQYLATWVTAHPNFSEWSVTRYVCIRSDKEPLLARKL